MTKRLMLNTGAALAFAWIAAAMPWEHLQGHPFVDHEQYLQHFLYEESIFEYTTFRSFLDYFFNEALWEYLVRTGVNSVGIPIDVLFLGISVLCLITFALFIARRHGALSIVLLFNPLLITFAFDQLRLALAYSLLLIAYMVRRPVVVVPLLLIALFIHTSIIIFVAAYFVIRKIVSARGAADNGSRIAPYALACLLGVAVSISIGPLREAILGYFGDRRAAQGAASSSFAYTSFWLGLLGLFGLQSRSFLRDEVNAYSVFILSIAAANIATGGYTLRFLSVGLPMIMSSMLSLPLAMRLFAIFLFLLYAPFHWAYWLGHPL